MTRMIVLGMTVWCGIAAGADRIDYQRDVQPIFVEHCTQCHGVDAAERKSGFRVDVRDDAVRGGESGLPAIVPGKTDAGELLRRIVSTDADLLMPPPSHNKPLSAAQIKTLEQWITEGAEYAGHWAFTPPVKPPVPLDAAAQPIDAFVQARLKSLRLTPAPAANAAELCRRLYLDVIGLPPSPEDVIAFQQKGYDATVEELLASERFGEKWARHWLDAARYSDTNGYEKDLPREQWKYRDWVIDAFNRDLPYDQFLIEQIAGDLLPISVADASGSERQSQLIATGFLRNSMINEEGAIIAEQFRMVEMFDRLDCLGKAVLGLTTQCAQCHTHKFDPLSHDEYYGLFAFLNNTYEAQSWVYTPEQLQQIADIQIKSVAINDRFKTSRPNAGQELAAWEQSLLPAQAEWEPITATELGSISGLNHPTQDADKRILMLGHTSVDVFAISEPKLEGITGLRLEALTHRDLPHNGPGRNRLGTWGVHEMEAFVKPAGAAEWTKLKLINATADFSEAEQEDADKKKKRGPVSFLIDGSDETTWTTDRGVGRRNQQSVAVVQFEQPLQYPAGSQLKIAWRMADMLGCARFSLTTAPTPATSAVDYAAQLAATIPTAQRTVEEQAAILNAWRTSLAEAKPFTDEIDALWKTYPVAATSILHLAERDPSEPRSTHLLSRGNWDQPLQTIEPQVPAAFHPYPADVPKNRLGFARWLADPQSPLTARVAVNRVWQAIFGTGLVETAEDFGTRAAVPVQRDLLDWLAVDFMEQGWSHKQLIRTIVRSATYKQSSRTTPEFLERDPRNHWLARGPRFRAEAEVVRDIALSVSGMLTQKMGGPGVIPPVPQNVLDYNFVYPAYWKAAEGPERYRRAVYGFRKRSMPDPVMSAFDAPNSDFACARRMRSNTPLAALTSLNEPIFVEAARGLALRVLREGGSTEESRCRRAFLLCTSREPNADELAAVVELLKSRRQRIADGWLNPREIATGDAAKLPELPPGATPQDAAAWTLAARVLLNLDETLTKN